MPTDKRTDKIEPPGAPFSCTPEFRSVDCITGSAGDRVTEYNFVWRDFYRRATYGLIAVCYWKIRFSARTFVTGSQAGRLLFFFYQPIEDGPQTARIQPSLYGWNWAWKRKRKLGAPFS